MRYILVLLCVLLQVHNSHAQNKITSRIILIGNAYEAAEGKTNLLDVIRGSFPFDSNTIVMYLGNNTTSPVDTNLLRREAAIADNTDASVFFVPGYQDWAAGREKGFKALRKQERFIKSLNNKKIKFYPGDGCPGPKNVDLKSGAELLIMDSEWWLHEHSKPDIESDCKLRTQEEILAEVEDIAKDNFDKLVIFVSHHPVVNTGVHSGTFGLKQHIFPLTDIRKMNNFYLPLPIIGSLYPITRNAVTTKQDMINEAYNTMMESGIGSLAGIRRAFSEHPHTLFISGQEHNLQLIQDGVHYQIISGAASGGGRVKHTGKTPYVSNEQGFSVLEITDDRKVKVRFFEVQDRNVKETFSKQLMDYSTLPPLAVDTTTMPMIDADSTIASTNANMANTTAMQRLLVGENYRQEWAAPVKMKVFHISTEKGGMKATGIGGGHESKSLQLEDASGKKWVLRAMNKNLDPVTPEGVQGTIASDVAQDLLSGVNPYGSLIVPGILEPLHIPHATPEMVFVPNDTALGEFRPLFANTVCQLEERKPALNDNKTKNTNEAINDMVKNSDHLADQKMFLKARFVDFMLSDFDRHHGQWSWGTIDTAGREMYYPIPKDRDQALYLNRGVIMDVGRRKMYKFMTNFSPYVKKMRNIGIVGVYMDMNFTNALSAEDWQMTLEELRETLTDNTLRDAAHRLPPEIYAIRKQQTENTLIARRDALTEKGMDYYRFISRKVNVLGGNKEDEFKVSGNDTGGVLVQVFAKGEDGKQDLKYSRTFDPAVTKEIRLYGFNGNDYFNIDESVGRGIKFRVVGGKGKDTFDMRGSARNYLYDLSFEDNEVVARNRTTKMFSNDPAVNEFKFRESIHNSLRFPRLSAGFNPDDGLLLGIGLSKKTQGFRKYPYASRQSVSGMFALTRKAYQFNYGGEFINVVRKYDLLLRGQLYNPVLNNFYGLGNETIRDENKPLEYYRARFSYASADAFIRKRFLNDSIMSISVGPTIYNYWYGAESNEGRILESPSVVGLDSSDVYLNKLYAGGKILFTINNVNDELVPIRGISWNTEFTAQKSLNSNSTSYTRLISTMDLYAELWAPAKLMIGVHLGGGHIFSNNFEYFQALTLGSNNYLRGYRRNRFAGSSMAYASTELRAKLFNFNAYVLKGDFGLVGFNDFGRVWMKNEASTKWHHGYGGGVYLIPFNAVMLSMVMGFSEEDRLFNVSFGTRINLTY